MVPISMDGIWLKDRRKKQVFILFALIIAGGLVFVSSSPAMDSHSARARARVSSPVESMHRPPTSTQNGLIESPSESIYQDRNLMITGNVAGGRHFQDVIPYSSPSSFQGELGSASLNSFMRRSVQTPYSVSSSGRLQPYYSPTQTVTSFRRGDASGLSTPQILPQGELPVYKSVPRDIFQGPQIIGQPMLAKRSPYAFDYDEIARQVAKQVRDADLKLTDELLYDQDRAAQIKKMIRELETTEIEKKAKDKSSKLEGRFPELPQRQEVQQPILTREQKEAELLKQAEAMPEKEKSLEQETQELTEFIEKELGITPRSRQDDIEAEPAKPKESTGKGEPQEKQGPNLAEELLTIPPDHKLAKKLLGDHKNFESLAKEKFLKYQKLADNFMKEGKYYEAINSWDLAEIWIKNHPDSAMGRGCALFAAGEYMSCVYYIEKALTFSEWDSEYNTGLLKLIDQTVFSENMAELGAIYKQTKSYRLGFLLAYLNYETQKIDKSMEYLTEIEDKMLQSQAYLNLKKAVDDAAVKEGSK